MRPGLALLYVCFVLFFCVFQVSFVVVVSFVYLGDGCFWFCCVWTFLFTYLLFVSVLKYLERSHLTPQTLRICRAHWYCHWHTEQGRQGDSFHAGAPAGQRLPDLCSGGERRQSPPPLKKKRVSAPFLPTVDRIALSMKRNPLLPRASAAEVRTGLEHSRIQRRGVRYSTI